MVPRLFLRGALREVDNKYFNLGSVIEIIHSSWQLESQAGTVKY